MTATVVLTISVILQFLAAALALRLVRLTERKAAWLLIAAAIVLMGVRRSITAFHVLSGDVAHPFDLSTELVALVTSTLMVVGVGRIVPFFRSAHRTEEALREGEQQLKASNQQLKASNQQLRATEQQLRASNQQLTASNQQLRATEQQLRAANQQLRAAEEVLRTSEAEKSLILDNVGDIIAYHDKNMRLVWANQAYLNGIGSITGTPVRMEEVRGLHCCEAWKLTKPCIGCPVSVALRTGETNEAELTPENQPHWPATQGAWSIKASPVHDAQGNIIGAIEVSRNITERKRAEETLRESEAKYRTLVENIPQKIFVKDRKFRFVSVNENFARDLGLRPEEVVGKMDADLFTPELAAKYHADDVRIMETGKTEELEERYIQEGRGTWVNTIKTPVRDTDGEIVGVLGVFWDITERKRMEGELGKYRDELEQRVQDRTARLDESNKELEAFSYSVSHDLRAPLRAINGFMRILMDDYEPLLNTEGKRVCSVIRENTGKMARLIDDLLAFSRLGRVEVQPSRIDMGGMANSVFYELTTPESRGRIDFEVGSLPAAVGDPSLMRQVWANLLGNAVKFSSKKERAAIKVSGDLQEGETVYAVQDNGVGFDMQYVQILFGVFQRLHGTREFEGTGVGLALVQRVIRRHGGRVWAEGEVGKGATFYFALPTKGKKGE